MTKYALLSFVVAAGLSGCAQLHFDRPGTTFQEFSRDSVRCRLLANGGNPGFMAMGNTNFVTTAALINAANNQELYKSCMQGEGYTVSYRVPDRNSLK